MGPLSISHEELTRLTAEASSLALDHWQSLATLSASPAASGDSIHALFARPWAEEGVGGNVLQDFKKMAERSRPSGGKFFGYVFGSGEAVGALGDFLASALNQNTTSWRSAPAAVTVERVIIGWIAEALGCDGFSGSLCGGGTAANLMGLAMAREAKIPANEDGASPGIVYASAEVHTSTPKAVALLGIGRKNLRLIPVDDSLRMRVDALETAIAADRQAGRVPIAIVASAGTVLTGSIDPIPEIAAVARRHDLWLHVDGAFGALAALAVPEKLAGLGLADSLSLDAHKWLYQPVDCGCLLYRDAAAARRAFSHDADYIRVFSNDAIESFQFFSETMELSRRFRALKLWMSLQYHGRRAFREAIGQDLHHAQLLAELISANPALELMAPVALSAVCFRHRDGDNQAILRRILVRGRVYLSNASIRGEFALRACFVNHHAAEADVRAIVTETLAAAEDVRTATA